MTEILIPTSEDKIIPMPEYDYAPLPLLGMELVVNSYWQARIDDGGVKIKTPAVISKKSNKEDL